MKLGSDAVGTVLGLLTIPMALLSIGSVGAGLALAVRQDWPPLVFGIAAFLIGWVLVHLLERLVIATDDAAALALAHGRRPLAHATAFVSGALPILVIFAAEIACLQGLMDRTAGAPGWLVWLWGYGVATGPWTLFAERVSRFRRSLVGIRAYAGHVTVWLFSLLILGLHASPLLLVATLLANAFIPVTVGLLLALADREAIANVRV
ncbi:hypothetical protein [Sphingomonas sp. CROZ-RG-20F-R02-07]|uniref:hypothetical protein n=1 Tax=Sphingomonas sp. CROZ-RG-20F-R02-07 TaxID=2914832 RepID=UPI001F5702FB|nr:hypothetical protein [Sphingomonas sp. CROZ-RG-20F-R02-07]